MTQTYFEWLSQASPDVQLQLLVSGTRFFAQLGDALLRRRPVGTWGQLGNSVRTGQPSFKRVHGMDNRQYRAQHPAAAAIFDAGMTSLATQVANAVVEAYDFSALGTVVDVGGGHGALLIAILSANPNLHSVLFDLPRVVEGAREPLLAAGILDRCEIVGGDMFDTVPVGGDAYVLSRVIHGWDDDHAIIILANCRRVMGPQSKLLLVQEVIPPGDSFAYGKLSDLNMLISPGGQERTEAEYRALYAAAGFTLTRVIPTRSRINVMEGTPI